MAVFASARAELTHEGVTAFNAHLHLCQVAELVSSVFADEFAAGRRGVLREAQMGSQLWPFLGSLMGTALFSNFVAGYVWVEGGRVIGNVTLQRADFSGIRWRICNVAVAPEQRGRGIACELMKATLREIARRGGNWAVLQVRTDNAAARHLYERLGFTNVCQDGLWKLPITPADSPAVDPDIALRPLGVLTWRARLELAHAARSPLAHWADAIHAADYQIGLLRFLGEALGRLTGLYRVERWGVWDGERLIAAVETRASITAAAHRMRFAVRPEARGHLESALVAQGLHSLAKASVRAVLVEHSGDHVEGVAALEAAGFRAQRVLLTMRRPIVPADAEL
jgi:ribosomal protein S18 acetylase RimI-like enzyme